MKRWIAAVLLLICLALPCAAAGETVVDAADLFTAEQEAALAQRAEELNTKYDINVVLITVDRYDTDTIAAFADDYYDYNGYAENGLLFALCMGTREYYTSTTGTMIAVFSDADIERLNSAALADLSAGDYYNAFLAYLNQADAMIDRYDPDADPDDYTYMDDYYAHYGEETAPKGAWKPYLIATVVAVVIAGIVLLFMCASMKTVRPARAAEVYVKPGSFKVTRSKDLFLYHTITRVKIESSSSSSGGGGTSVHSGSSGSSHGGGGGHF